MTEPLALTVPAEVKAATRIHVDHDEDGAYVYRLVDAATGRIVAELPRHAWRALTAPDGDVAWLAAAAAA